jgi:hypothetical protein
MQKPMTSETLQILAFIGGIKSDENTARGCLSEHGNMVLDHAIKERMVHRLPDEKILALTSIGKQALLKSYTGR